MELWLRYVCVCARAGLLCRLPCWVQRGIVVGLNAYWTTGWLKSTLHSTVFWNWLERGLSFTFVDEWLICETHADDVWPSLTTRVSSTVFLDRFTDSSGDVRCSAGHFANSSVYQWPHLVISVHSTKIRKLIVYGLMMVMWYRLHWTRDVVVH